MLVLKREVRGGILDVSQVRFIADCHYYCSNGGRFQVILFAGTSKLQENYDARGSGKTFGSKRIVRCYVFDL